MNKSTSRSGRGLERGRAREQFWRDVVKEFAGSGQTVRAYCAQRQLSEPSFFTWRKMLAQRDAAGAKAAGPAPARPTFVPVHLAGAGGGPEAGTAGSLIEVVLAGGRCVRVGGPVDRAALAAVVAVLEGLPRAESAPR